MDSCVVRFYMFSFGYRHTIIGKIQAFLRLRSFVKKKPMRIFVYDDSTKAALADFQRHKRLRVTDGSFNEETYAAIGSEMKARELEMISLHHPVLKYLLQGKPQNRVPFDVTRLAQVEKQNGNANDERVDNELAKLLTDTGIIRAASVGDRVVTAKSDSHFKLRDGKVFTIHVYGDECGNAVAGLYLPVGFDNPKYEGGQGIVSAVHKKTRYILGIAHVSVKSQVELDRNLKSGKKNAAQSRYIGNIGGDGGENVAYIHSHIHLFPSVTARAIIKAIKSQNSGGRDPSLEDSKHLVDVRELLRI